MTEKSSVDLNSQRLTNSEERPPGPESPTTAPAMIIREIAPTPDQEDEKVDRRKQKFRYLALANVGALMVVCGRGRHCRGTRCRTRLSQQPDRIRGRRRRASHEHHEPSVSFCARIQSVKQQAVRPKGSVYEGAGCVVYSLALGL